VTADTDARLAAPPSTWLHENGSAYAVGDGPDILITTRRSVTAWAELSAEERVDVLALVDRAGVGAGLVRFELVSPGRWHLRVRPSAPGFAALPGFTSGREQQLLPALQRALARADATDLLSAFLQPSGVAAIRDDLEDALRRGAAVRILTGDYLAITSPIALYALLDLADQFPTLQAAVYRCEGRESFHAKAYIFVREHEAVAYVGSSNLSRTALTGGVEWNLRALGSEQGGEIAAIRAAFERLWTAPATLPLTRAWIDAYATRPRPAPVGAWDPPAPPPEPHEIQRDALAALADAIAKGARGGLVVLATGLGKTLLAAFAARQMDARRVLFVAHREEIIVQARKAFEVVLPERSSGLFRGSIRDRDADMLFATIQTLGRPDHLATWPRDHFDLVIVDEFHHASASYYRRLLEHFTPKFMLGVTATPERGDGADLLALCGDRQIYRASLVEGIARGRLVPFAYHGLKDDVDYRAIPWRSGRFDPEALTRALATRAHAEQALAAYRTHAPTGPRRGLWFCASIEHAEFMARFLCERGISAVAVHSGPGGAARSDSLRRLKAGELEAITAVDVFNEGVDVPDINIVVLLRPTESRVVFLQQIGRGLRLPDRSEKPRLVILDFIGNHRSFLSRPQALLALLDRSMPSGAALRELKERREEELPAGCSVDIDVDAIALLEGFSREHPADTIIFAFMRLRDELGRRPTLAELVADGIRVGAVAEQSGSWWDLLKRLGEIEPDEERVFAVRRDELIALERAPERALAPWQALQAWINHEGLAGLVDEPAIIPLWPKALTRAEEVVRLRSPVDPTDRPILEAMIAEIAEARAKDAARPRPATRDDGLILKVSHFVKKDGRPGKAMIFVPETLPAPRGEVEVWVEGEPYLFRFKKIAVNVATTRPGGLNVLPAILRGLFGSISGHSGTAHHVVLAREDGRWTLRPLVAEPTTTAPLLPYYADLAVACGLGDIQHDATNEARMIPVKTAIAANPRRHFIVRAAGDSMDGGDKPIRDGDLVLCERLEAPPADFVEGKPCLLIAAVGPEMSEAMIKVPVRAGKQWLLRSWSKGQADLAVSRWQDLRVVARVLEVVRARVE